jgi:3-dehydroquinate synthase
VEIAQEKFMTPHSQIIPVQAPNAEYSIYVGSGWLDVLPDLLAQRMLNGKVAFVTNTTLAPLYGDKLRKSVPNSVVITVPDGEQHKTLDTVRTLYDSFLAAGLDRKAVIVAFGGGVIGDMVGFAAATYLRGVAFVQIPTSLLSMVDASVGGKVGVDLPQGKNLIGAFKQPELVIIDTDVLNTLPDVEWRCGVAEVVKAGLLRDTSLLDAKLYTRENAVEFISKAVKFKVDIVQEDPYENGIRATLNLGHTFGHAVEAVSQFQWRHGEAVALGLVAAARLSQVHGLCEPNLPYRVENLIKSLGLPTRYKNYASADIRAAMNTDKKRSAGKIRFILLRSPGDPVIVGDVPDAKIISVLDSLRE